MSEFAKIFEIEGDQVLLVKTTNEEDAPCIEATLELPNGVQVTAKLGYENSDIGEATRDRVFHERGEERAEAFRSMVLRELSPLTGNELESVS